MNKRQSNEMQSIRKKLLAAIAMLLIACIMTVSSTYAWFTLSTAPEVKGITTTVGANGNLEIALGEYDTVYGTEIPTSGEGTSMDKANSDKTLSNLTWGNLIDLADASYGWDAIKLYPTRLNATFTDGKGFLANPFSPLAYPIYGSDGRISELSANTLIGKYEGTSFMALGTPNYAGVNGIGSVSGMSEREFAGRNYKNAVESNRITAKNEAQGAISLYSGDLAAIAIKNMDDNPDGVVTEAEITVLKNLIAKLEKSAGAIDESLKSAVMVALTGIPAETLTDGGWKDAVTTIGNKNVNDTIAQVQSLSGMTVPSSVTSVVEKYNAIVTNLNTAESKLPASGDSTWGTVKDAVSALLKTTGITICNETIADIKATKDSTEADTAFKRVTKEALAGNLNFQFASGSGVLADIADFVGEYSATISFPEDLEVEGIPVGGLKRPVAVKMSAEASVVNAEGKGYLGAAYDAVKNTTIPGADPNASKALTDTYGYSIDLLFRTNAADSYLELQTAAANRIYAENSNEMLMGGGSNMSFTVGGEYTKDKIDGLAEGIRVVFYDTTSTNHEILGVATLDTNGTISGDQYKMDLKLTNYTIADKNGEIPGKLTTTGFIDTDDANTAQDDRVALAALSANSVKKISALVYLDGDVVDNSDVGVAAILNGKLNLQFASSASLVPMDNNTLMNTTPETT